MLDIIDLECKYKDDVIFSGLTIKNLDKGMNFIKGRSGCGKTSLIKLLIGMNIIEKGKIIFFIFSCRWDILIDVKYDFNHYLLYNI